MYVEYIGSVVGHVCAMCHAYCSGAHARNVKFMYTSAPGHIVECIKLI